MPKRIIDEFTDLDITWRERARLRKLKKKGIYISRMREAGKANNTRGVTISALMEKEDGFYTQDEILKYLKNYGITQYTLRNHLPYIGAVMTRANGYIINKPKNKHYK